jgi:hypothetical protein
MISCCHLLLALEEVPDAPGQYKEKKAHGNKGEDRLLKEQGEVETASTFAGMRAE